MPKLKCKLCHDSLWINLGILTVYGKPYVSDITVCARNRPIFNGSALHIFHDKRHPDIMSESEISRFLSHLASTARYRHQLRIKPCQHFCFCTRMFWNNNSTGLRMLCMQNGLVAYRLFFNTCRGYVTACRNTWCQRPYCPPAVRYRHATDGVSEVAHQGYRHSTSSDTRALGEGGDKDRITILPERLVLDLQKQTNKACQLHQHDLREGFGETRLPYALARKYPNAGREWGWQFVFPSSALKRGGRGVRSPLDSD